MKENTVTIVDNLKSELAHATKNFAEILTMRTKNLKEQNTRRKEYENNSQLLRKRTVNFDARIMVDDITPEEPNPQKQESLQTQEQLPPEEQDEYFLSRVAAVESIEKTITELAEMYQRFTTIVALQEELVIRIDQNMDDTLLNVQKGTGELQRYYHNISNSTWLIMKVFAIIIIFAIFFIFIM